MSNLTPSFSPTVPVPYQGFEPITVSDGPAYPVKRDSLSDKLVTLSNKLTLLPPALLVLALAAVS